MEEANGGNNIGGFWRSEMKEEMKKADVPQSIREIMAGAVK